MARKATTPPAKATAKPAPTRASTEASAKSAKVTAKPVKAAAKSPAPKATSGGPVSGRAKPAATIKGKVGAPPPKPTTVTLKHLAAGLSDRRGLPKRDAEVFAADLIGGLLDQVKAGAKVRIAGLGVIEVKDRPARTARNPATGAPVQVAASRKIVFRVARDLKDAI